MLTPVICFIKGFCFRVMLRNSKAETVPIEKDIYRTNYKILEE